MLLFELFEFEFEIVTELLFESEFEFVSRLRLRLVVDPGEAGAQ